MKHPTSNNIAQMFHPVNSHSSKRVFEPTNSMIHHKSLSNNKRIIYPSNLKKLPSSYGVSQFRRVLTPELYIKKFDYLRDCLRYTLGMTTAQREVTLRLLRYWAYYGQVYPKEATVTEAPGCKKATYWRTIRYLRELGLIEVVNRFIIRPHAQISNLYRLDNLVLLLARYLAEHGVQFFEEWLKPALAMPGQMFWSQIYQSQEVRAGPGLLALPDL